MCGDEKNSMKHKRKVFYTEKHMKHQKKQRLYRAIEIWSIWS